MICRYKKRKIFRMLFSFFFITLILLISIISIAKKNIKNASFEENLTEDPEELVKIGFTARESDPDDEEIKVMVDEVINQVLGKEGLKSLIKQGDKVVIKVNIVDPYRGAPGEKGRGIITDPRIVRYVAEKVRSIIGYDGSADLKVVDATFNKSDNPSLKSNKNSFYWANLNIIGKKQDKANHCYDNNADGILDGISNAKLINLDSLDINERFVTVVKEETLGKVKVVMPKFIRTKEEALKAGEPDKYCDVFIGLPVFKSHAFAGVTGALKLHYGFKYYWANEYETARWEHNGYGWGTGDKRRLISYLCAQSMVRKYDFVIMDCLTGNRRGPINLNFDNKNVPTDFIVTNALLSSKDPVAIDTVEALFGGYNPESIKLLEAAFFNNLGINKIKMIFIADFDNFGKHRNFLINKYKDVDKNYRTYPFADGWGGAKIMKDFSAPVNVTISDPQLKKDNEYVFKYTAFDNNNDDLGLSRIDFLVDSKIVMYKIDDLKNEGIIEVNLKKYLGKECKYKIAVWDKSLNCTLSDEKIFNINF